MPTGVHLHRNGAKREEAKLRIKGGVTTSGSPVVHSKSLSPHSFLSKFGRNRYIGVMVELDPLTRRSADLFLARARERYSVVEAWLYGSRARGDAREDSDVDLALVIEGEMPSASSVAAAMSRETSEVLDETGQYVSPLPIRAAHWREPARHPNPFLLANIKREGIAL